MTTQDVKENEINQTSKERLSKLRKVLEQEQIDLLIISKFEDIFYLTGFQTPGASLICLLVAQKSCFLVARILELTNALKIPWLLNESSAYGEDEDRVKHLVNRIKGLCPSKVGMEEDSLRMTFGQQNRIREFLKSAGIHIVNSSDYVSSQRISKSEEELCYHRRAGEIASNSVRVALLSLRPGMTEIETGGVILQSQRKDGSEYAAYPPFVCFGEHSNLGHYTGGRTKLEKGMSVFIETGACYNRYHTALMRTAFCGDAIPQTMLDAEACVQKAISSMRLACKPGVICSEIAKLGISCLQLKDWTICVRMGYSIGIGFPIDWGESDVIHISEDSQHVLIENATLHLIPWIQHVTYGGVGLSDTIVVKPNGGESLLGDYKPPEAIFRIPVENRILDACDEVFSVMEPTPTPLHRLNKSLTESLGVRNIYIKDESKRMGGPAFKTIGGCYSIFKELLRHRPHLKGSTFKNLKIENEFTFCTATDGNHGFGVAYAAQQLGQSAVIYMPKGAAPSRVKRIEQMGAKCLVQDVGYDETVRLSAMASQKNGWFYIQDTTLPNYEIIPRDIMDAYTVMVKESLDELEQNGEEMPTHVILQVGVGSMAGAVVEYLQARLGSSIQIITVEPDTAGCLFTSLSRGVPTVVESDQNHHTVMAGLDCGTVSALAWPVLRDSVRIACVCDDTLVGNGVRILNRENIMTGESGACIGIGLLDHIQSYENDLKDMLNLNDKSVVFLINTEGITNEISYNNILKTKNSEGSLKIIKNIFYTC